MKTFKLPQLKKPQDLLDFIANDMDACIHKDFKEEILGLSEEHLSRMESITVGEKEKMRLARTIEFNYRK